MSRSLLLLLVAGAAALVAEEIPVVEPLPPQPVSVPQLPDADSPHAGDPDGLLAERIEGRVRELEREIADFLRERGGELPQQTVELVPQVDDERERRDEAWQRLRAALDERERSPGGYDSDVLDHAPRMASGPSASAEEVDPAARSLTRQNRLHMAQCHYHLLEGDDPAVHARAGAALVAAIDPAELPVTLRPEWHFLGVAFAVAQAREATDAQARSQHLAEARRRLAVFAKAMPDHVRVDGARMLIEDFELEARVQAVEDEIEL